MAKGYPSMLALLGLVAVAGYQNRDKIAEMLRRTANTGRDPNNPNNQGGNLGGLFDNIRGAAGAGGVGGMLSSGLGELVDRFRQSGRQDVAQSWVNRGPNQPVSPEDLRSAIGPDVLQQLSQQTGLSQEELLSRLSRELPDAVDKYTPDGRLPDERDEAFRT
jgi:uncharacterized protein YidB (DUF937 family)